MRTEAGVHLPLFRCRAGCGESENAVLDSLALTLLPCRYTSLGHGSEIWRDVTFQSHIRGGIDWVLANGTMPERPAPPTDNSTLVATPSQDGKVTGSTPPTSAGSTSATKGSLAGLFVLALVGTAVLL